MLQEPDVPPLRVWLLAALILGGLVLLGVLLFAFVKDPLGYLTRRDGPPLLAAAHDGRGVTCTDSCADI